MPCANYRVSRNTKKYKNKTRNNETNKKGNAESIKAI
jgi:hypothetical protein